MLKPLAARPTKQTAGANQPPCALSRCALTPKKVATGRQPPNNGPLATFRAPSPTAIADEPPPSSSMASRAPSLASRSSIRCGDAHSATARNNNLRSASIPMAVRESGCRSLPDHISPSCSRTACPPIPHFAWRSSAGFGGLDGRRCGFKSSSNHKRYVCSQKWLVTWSETTVSTPRQSRPPSRLRGEQRPVDGDCKARVPDDVVDPAQSILKAVRKGRRIERGHVKLNPRSCEFDTHPMQDAVPLFGALQTLATGRDARKDLPWRRRAPLPIGRIRPAKGQ
jgi:hypothetical protein